MHKVHIAFCVSVLYDTETGCVCLSEKPFNGGNIQTETFSLRRSQTRMHEHFRWSQTCICISFPSHAPCCKKPAKN